MQGEDWGWRREHSLKGLVHHSWLGGSLGKSLELPKKQETLVSGCARRGDSEHRLNELQRRARAMAISADPRGGHEPRLTARTPETGASRGYQRGPQRRA